MNKNIYESPVTKIIFVRIESSLMNVSETSGSYSLSNYNEETI